ncbi:hypothetical protein IQ06DRAFT_297097 [Phaeosphaeriaceae sp. SRC1lsM3a]|nr:hypothetical protein IQ06DRAFT_297097 [Stagonospora sp. SRC1lsM3a]
MHGRAILLALTLILPTLAVPLVGPEQHLPRKVVDIQRRESDSVVKRAQDLLTREANLVADVGRAAFDALATRTEDEEADEDDDDELEVTEEEDDLSDDLVERGVRGSGNNKRGVRGSGNNKRGVRGSGNNKRGVRGSGNNKRGVRGSGNNKRGVRGSGNNKRGVRGSGNNKRAEQSLYDRSLRPLIERASRLLSI